MPLFNPFNIFCADLCPRQIVCKGVQPVGCETSRNCKPKHCLFTQGYIWNKKKEKNRIIESFEMEATLEGHLVQLYCNEQGQLQLDQLAQCPVQPATSSGTELPPDHHWLWKYWEWLGDYISSLRTVGYISSGPTDLSMSSFLKQSRTWSSLKVGRICSPSFSPFNPSVQGVCEKQLPVKTKAKLLPSTSTFSSVCLGVQFVFLYPFWCNQTAWLSIRWIPWLGFSILGG